MFETILPDFERADARNRLAILASIPTGNVQHPEIFIVGAPRSGTTLLRNMLNRHPRLAICYETQFFRYVFARRWAFGDLGNSRNRRRLIAEYTSTHRIQRLGMNAADFEERLMREGVSYEAFFASLLACYAGAEGKARWGEKTPHHARFTELLCEWYPGASILHVVRDPRDVVAALQRVPWASNSVLTNARTWLTYNLAASQSSHRPGYIQIRYETLVNQPDEELARICEHLGERYYPSMLIGDQEKVRFRSWSQRSGSAITNERIGAWRDELSEDSIRLIDRVVGEHGARYGYARTSGTASHWAVTQGLLVAGLEALRLRANRLPASLWRLMHPTKLSKEELLFYGGLRANSLERNRG